MYVCFRHELLCQKVINRKKKNSNYPQRKNHIFYCPCVCPITFIWLPSFSFWTFFSFIFNFFIAYSFLLLLNALWPCRCLCFHIMYLIKMSQQVILLSFTHMGMFSHFLCTRNHLELNPNLVSSMQSRNIIEKRAYFSDTWNKSLQLIQNPSIHFPNLLVPGQVHWLSQLFSGKGAKPPGWFNSPSGAAVMNAMFNLQKSEEWFLMFFVVAEKCEILH